MNNDYSSPLLTAETKALLVSIGSVRVERALLPASRGSTAGPGVGLKSVFFKSGERKVRLFVDNDSPLSIHAVGLEKGMVELRRGKETLALGTIEQALAHCPKQAFVTLSEKCIFDCKYCAVPKSQGRVKTDAEILQLIEEVYRKGELEAISVTSGVEESVEAEVQRVLKLLPSLKAYNVPIGVSVYPTEGCSALFRDAGVSEVKYNIETMDPGIFRQVCGGLSQAYILEQLEDAVDVFGKNRVFTNFIIGLGESDGCVEKGIEKLASFGVIPLLRPVNPHPLRKGDCFMERPSPERLLKLAEVEKEVLAGYGLNPALAKTMCPKCTGCDLVPFVDV